MKPIRVVLNLFHKPRHQCDTGHRTGPEFGPNRLWGSFVCSSPDAIGIGDTCEHRIVFFHKYPETVKAHVRLSADRSSPLRFRRDPSNPKKNLLAQRRDLRTADLTKDRDAERRFGLGSWGSYAEVTFVLERVDGTTDVASTEVKAEVHVARNSLELRPKVGLR